MAAFERQPKLPALTAMLRSTMKGAKHAPAQTMAQQLAQLALLAEFIGKPLRPAVQKKKT